MLKICRTCLQTIKGEYEFINTDIPAYNLDIISTCNKLQNFMPELDLTLVPSPVICTDCITALDVAYKFKNQCRQTDEDIRAYLQNPNCIYDPAKLLEFVQETKEAKNVIVKTEYIENETEVEPPIFEPYPACDDQNEDIKPLIKTEIEDEVNVASNESYFQQIDEQNLFDIKAVERGYRIPSDYFLDLENKFKCDICSLGFRRRQALIEHKRTHVFRCSFCGIVTKTRSGLMAHTKIHSARQFRCDSCDYSSNNKIAFMTHSIVHTGIKPFPCDKCDRRFASYNAAEKHKKNYHLPVYKCPTCGYSTLDSCRMRYHLKTHTGERPFSCPKCDYRAGTNGTLQAHIKTHNNECHLCSFRTKDEFNLLNHLILHVHKDRPKLESTIKKEEVDECPEDANVDSNSTNKYDEEQFDTQMEVETNDTCKGPSNGDKAGAASHLNFTHMEEEMGNDFCNKETSVDTNTDNTMKKCDKESDLNIIQIKNEIISDTINEERTKEANTNSNSIQIESSGTANIDNNCFNKCYDNKSDSDLNKKMEVETNDTCKGPSNGDKAGAASYLNSTHMEEEMGNDLCNKETSVDTNTDNTMKKCDEESDLNIIQIKNEIISDTINEERTKEANTNSNSIQIESSGTSNIDNNCFNKCYDNKSDSDLNKKIEGGTFKNICEEMPEIADIIEECKSDSNLNTTHVEAETINKENVNCISDNIEQLIDNVAAENGNLITATELTMEIEHLN